MLKGYKHAAMTLNFIRSLMVGGFADLHHPEYWDLGFLSNAALAPELREDYQEMVTSLSEGLRLTEALGERDISELHRAEFFTSHEGLNLLYESAQTRQVPRRTGYYNLTTHLPWIGERTRELGGAHIEYFRGIENPVAVKIGPSIDADELAGLINTLNTTNEAGKLILVTRLGTDNVNKTLPILIEIVKREGFNVLWVCDPMHANTTVTDSGYKTRNFELVLKELESTLEAHELLGSRLGGVHIELTGEDVTECVGGASGLTEDDLFRNYTTVCDPRLNYQQSLELAFLLARRMRRAT
jgi:3-deoxy-7-phosphoheptulonate synthase